MHVAIIRPLTTRHRQNGALFLSERFPLANRFSQPKPNVPQLSPVQPNFHLLDPLSPSSHNLRTTDRGWLVHTGPPAPTKKKKKKIATPSSPTWKFDHFVDKYSSSYPSPSTAKRLDRLRSAGHGDGDLIYSVLTFQRSERCTLRLACCRASLGVRAWTSPQGSHPS